MILRTMTLWLRMGLLIISAVGCAHTHSRSGLVMVAEGIGFELLPPADFGHSLMLTQAAEISFAGETRELIFYTEITADQVVIVGTLNTGTRVFVITYDGRTVASEGHDGPYAHIAPEYFLADLQLAQWPFGRLMSSFAAHSPCFASGECMLSDSAEAVVENGGGDRRILEYQAMPVLSIYYSDTPRYQGTTEIIHHQRDYSLTITTVDVEVL